MMYMYLSLNLEKVSLVHMEKSDRLVNVLFLEVIHVKQS